MIDNHRLGEQREGGMTLSSECSLGRILKISCGHDLFQNVDQDEAMIKYWGEIAFLSQ